MKTERIAAGRNRVVSAFMAGVLAFGLMPLPAYAGNDYAPSSVDTQSLTTLDTSGSEKPQNVIGLASRAAEPAPELLGLDNPETNEDKAPTDSKMVFFGTDINSNPDPYFANYNKWYQAGKPANDSDYTPRMLINANRGSGNGPMAAFNAYDLTAEAGSSVSNQLWDMKPDVIIGTGSDDVPSNEATFYQTDAFARAAERANGWASGSYNPVGVTYNRINLNTMISVMYKIAAAADKAVKDSNGAKTLRYSGRNDDRFETATDIAKAYETYVTGMRGYVLMKIDDGTVPMRTVANVSEYDSDSGLFKIIAEGQAEGTATANRLLEAVQGVTYNYETTSTAKEQTSGKGTDAIKYKWATIDELRNNVDIIIWGGNSTSDTALVALSNEGLLDKTYYTDNNMGTGAIYGVTVNSVENAQNVGRILPGIYPEVLDASDMIAYYYDTFYHIKDSALTSTINTYMRGVRNWESKNNSSDGLLTWNFTEQTTGAMDGYVQKDVEAMLTQGVGYLNTIKNDKSYRTKGTNKGLADVLQPTTNVADAALDFSSAHVAYSDYLLSVYSEVGLDASKATVTLGNKTIANTQYDVTFAKVDGSGTTSIAAGEHSVTLQAGDTIKVTATPKSGSGYATTTSASGTFKIVNPIAGATIDSAIGEQTYTGMSIVPDVTVKLDNATLKQGEDFELELSNNVNPGTAKIEKIVGIGEYSGEVVPAANNTFTIKGVTITPTDVKVGEWITTTTKEGQKTTSTTEFKEGQFTYTGSAAKPTVLVTQTIKEADSSAGTAAVTHQLVNGTDFIVDPDPNAIDVADSTYTVKIKAGSNKAYKFQDGNNDYIEKTFKIVTANFSDLVKIGFAENSGVTKEEVSSGRSTVTEYHATFTGTALNPALDVKIAGKAATLTTDYTVEHSNATGPGLDTITVKPAKTNNYTDDGKATIALYIDADFKEPSAAGGDGVTVALTQSEYTYDGSNKSPTLTAVTYKKGTVTKDLKAKTDDKDTSADFSVAYSNNKNAGTGTVTLTGMNGWTGTIKKTFKINPIDITAGNASNITGVTESVEYKGSPIKFEDLEVAYTSTDNTKLSKTFKVSDGTAKAIYLNNTKPGRATVIITVAGNYAGAFTKTFEITTEQKDISNTASIAAIDDQAVGAEPALVVKNGNDTLTANEDYVVTYSDNDKPGTATATAVGIGLYKGSVSKTFAVKYAMQDATVSLSKASTTYTGAAQAPTVSVKNKAGYDLVSGTEYTLTYKRGNAVTTDFTSAGTITVTVTGKGTWMGAKTATYTIKPATITSVAFSPSSTPWTGAARTGAVTVKAGSTTVPASGYSVAYRNNTNAGTATVTVTGKGNYTGTKSANFTITKVANSLATKAASKTFKLANVKKKAQSFTAAVVKTAGQGTLSYGKATVKTNKGKTNATTKKFKVSKNKITVPKGAAKGTYVVTLPVSCAGDTNHNASGAKTAKVTVTVK